MKFLFGIFLLLGYATSSLACNPNQIFPKYSYADFYDAKGKPTMSENAVDLLNCISHEIESVTAAETLYEVDMFKYGKSNMTSAELFSYLGDSHSDKGVQVTSPDATDLATAITLLNEIKGVLNAMNGF